MNSNRQIQESTAAAWRHDLDLEKLAALQKSSPDLFAKLPVRKRLAVGRYIAGRDAAQALKRNR